MVFSVSADGLVEDLRNWVAGCPVSGEPSISFDLVCPGVSDYGRFS